MRVVLHDVEPGLGGLVRRVSHADLAAAEAHFHSHVELELNLVQSGWCRYLFEDRRCDLHRGSVLWLFPDQEHQLVESSSDFAMHVAVFEPSLVRAKAAQLAAPALIERDPPGYHHRLLGPEALRELLAILQATSDATIPPLLRRDGLAWLLTRSWILYQKSADAPRADLDPAIARAAQLLQGRALAWGLPQLAREVGRSASWLSRRFHAQLGMTLVEYRNRQRLSRFLDRWPDRGGRTLLAAALQAGFTSYPQFSRIFRQLLGAGPRTYLRRHRL